MTKLLFDVQISVYRGKSSFVCRITQPDHPCQRATDHADTTTDDLTIFDAALQSLVLSTADE